MGACNRGRTRRGPRLGPAFGRVRAAGLWLFAFLLLVGLATPAQAHPAATSLILVERGASETRVELRLPVDQLLMALQHGEVDDPAVWFADNEAQLQTYVAEHVALASEDGTQWILGAPALRLEFIDELPHIVARMRATPPTGEVDGPIHLRSDAIVHRVVSHRLLVVRGRNFEQARFAEESLPIGMLHYKKDTVVIEDEGGSWWRGFVGMVGLGADHIAHGSDHLLFILALLLAAVVRPVAGRWAGGRPTGEGLRAIAWVVSAFTIGHTLTLILGVTGVVRLPSQPVEIAIALTLVVSAAHALRPIFPRHEAWIAAGFGLIHGLAFASELADFAPDKLSLGLGLAGFNIGIELVQLLIVVAITPSLLVLARTPAYRYLRIGGASIVIVAATGWLLERVGLDLGLEAEFNTLDQVAPWVVLGLAIGLAVLAGVLGKKRRQLPATGVVATSSGSA